jgi:hypothetical protein
MRKQPRARQAKSKSRQAAYYDLVKKTAKKVRPACMGACALGRKWWCSRALRNLTCVLCPVLH